MDLGKKKKEHPEAAIGQKRGSSLLSGGGHGPNYQIRENGRGEKRTLKSEKGASWALSHDA